MALPPVTTGMALVFGLILVALVLFVTELISSDITAVGVLVALAVLEPYTGVAAGEAISGFASSATVTIVAMYILSEGIQRTGIVERLGVYLARITKGDESRLLAATVGTTGISAGIVNNTPVVAVFIPMITGLAERAGISRSKLLLPLSYAAMLGGTLTLIGTSTNILASDFARQLPGRGPIGMFEFTPLGIVVLLVGAAYLLTVGRRLTPARIPPDQDLTEQFDLEDELSRLTVREDSELVGSRVEDVAEELEATPELAVDLLQLDREEESFHALTSDRTVEPGDTLTVRGSLQAVNQLAETFGLRQLAREEVTDDDLVTEASTLVEAVVLPDSRLVGETIPESGLEAQFDTTVLEVRRDGSTLEDLTDFTFHAGDTLLLHTTLDDATYLQEAGDVVLSELPDEGLELLEPDADESVVAPLSPKTPVAVAIMAAVIGVAALGLVPIVIAALGGVFAMVVTGCLDPSDAYDAVSWNIVFLLAGVLPLGLAMQRTGGAEFIAALVVSSADVLPVLAVLGLFYLLTGLLANIITPVASVVLMIPVAVDTAGRIGGEPFSFLLAVTFAASAAFMTPIGYQTNLMVYGPGGYKFTDYVRVGAPLQLLLAVVVTLGIATLFGV
ncbi:SLC13 family permease [Haloglomus litoreum]|uniref:SLC13 family permease n=1 Tax=Haloglomus litoreum TaxID=3034026 RepID=UPI0023E790D0|nr:SLC13 family permease [Haloglomus sp. DT116]